MNHPKTSEVNIDYENEYYKQIGNAITIKKQIKIFEEKLKNSINIIENEVGSINLANVLSGGNPPKYKSTGKAVYIMYKKRKYKRTIYVKDKRKTKYCKINNEYILLSKLKVVE